MADYFRYFPIRGTPITLGSDSYPLRNYLGTGNTLVQPQSQKAPFQKGVSYLNADVNPRTIVISLRLKAKTLEEMNLLKRTLASKLVAEPVRVGVAPLGILRFFRDGAETLEINAVPVASPDFIPVSVKGNIVDAEIEFFCPLPYWRSIIENSHEFESAGEALFPSEIGGLEFPFEFLSGDLEVEIDNNSDVEVPVRARIFGEVDTFRMINETIDETLEIEGVIEEGDFIEVNTSFGEKSVIYHYGDTGEEESVFERVSLAAADFWQLIPGVNQVRFEFDSITTGSGRIFWRERRAGV